MAVQISQMRPITRQDPLGQTLGYQKEMGNVREINAKAQMEEAKARNPLLGSGLTGPAAQAMSLEYVRSMYGEDSPQYQQAKNYWDTAIAQKQATTAYMGANPEFRNLPDDAKQVLLEQGYVPHSGPTPGSAGGSQGGYPTPTRGMPQQGMGGRQAGGAMGGQGMAPGQEDQPQTAMQRTASLARLKSIGDPQTRQKTLYATNISKTLEQIDPQALVQYGGLPGAVKKKLEEGKALVGKESDEYDKYQQAVVGARLLAKQTRQFYGDSIRPAVAAELKQLASPATWATNPKLALQKYDKFKQVLESELDTYRDSLTTASTYQKPKAKAKQQGGRAMQDINPAQLSNEQLLQLLSQGEQ